MEAKLPQFSHCCCSTPLKKGLLILAYINAVIHGVTSIVMFFLGSFLTVISLGMAGTILLEFVLLIPAVTICIAIFYILVIVASNKESVHLLRVSFISGVSIWVFVILYGGCIVGRLGSFLHNEYSSPAGDQLGFTALIMFIVSVPCIQGYTLLLVRSLELKLKAESPGDFQVLHITSNGSSNYVQF